MIGFPLLEALSPTISDHRKSRSLRMLGVLVGVRHGELGFVGHVVAGTGAFFWFYGPRGTVVFSMRVSHHEAQNAPNTLRLSVTHTCLLPSTPGCSILYLRTQLPALWRESTLSSTHTHFPLFHVLFNEECLTGVLRKLLLSLPSLSVVTSSCQQSSSQKSHVLPMATFLLYQWPRVQTQLTFLRIHSFPEYLQLFPANRRCWGHLSYPSTYIYGIEF